MLRSLRHLLLIIAITTALVGPLAGAAYARGGARFSAQPVGPESASPEALSYFVFDTQPGSTVRGALRVTNTGTEVGTARLYGVDATTGQTAGTVYFLRDDPRRHVGTWIVLDREELTLNPGEAEVVTFTVNVAPDAVAGNHVGGIVVEDVDLKEGASPSSVATQVKLQNRLALAVQVNVPGNAVENLELGGLRPDGGDGYQVLLLQLQNSGTTLLRPSGVVDVHDASGRLIQHLRLNLDTVLPLTAIEYPVFLEGTALGQGSYLADLVLSYGSGKQATLSARFDISPTQAAQVFVSRERLMPPDPAAIVAPDLAPGPSVWLLIGRLAHVLLIGLGITLLSAGYWMRWRSAQGAPTRPGRPGAVPLPSPKGPVNGLDWRLD